MRKQKGQNMKDNMTLAQKYDPAMKITNQVKADAYFQKCVEHTMRVGKQTRAEAERIERVNLGYYAGYYDHKTRLRVERLFKCVHPILGPASKGELSIEEVFETGKRIGEKLKSTT